MNTTNTTFAAQLEALRARSRAAVAAQAVKSLPLPIPQPEAQAEDEAEDEVTPRYNDEPGTGRIFADQHISGEDELLRITGWFIIPEGYGLPVGMTVRIKGEMRKNEERITFIGAADGLAGVHVHGYLNPDDEADTTYKYGSLFVGSKYKKDVEVRIGSKAKVAKSSGKPYRWLYVANRRVRAAC